MGQTTFDVPAGKVDGDVGVLNTKVGDLSSLTTTAKTNLVSAVNEIDSDVSVLSGKITNVENQITSVSTGTIAKASRVTSGTLDMASCRKVGNIVYASGRIHSISESTVTASGTFFTLPSGFRPPSNVTAYGTGYLNTHDGLNAPLLANIYSDGSVSVSYSSNKYASQVGFSACFSTI